MSAAAFCAFRENRQIRRKQGRHQKLKDERTIYRETEEMTETEAAGTKETEAAAGAEETEAAASADGTGETAQTEEPVNPVQRAPEGAGDSSGCDHDNGNDGKKRRRRNRESGRAAGFSAPSFFEGMAAAVLILVCAALVFYALPVTGSPDSPLSAGSLKKMTTIIRLIDDNFAGDADKKTMADGMYSGIMASLGDKYAAYYTADEMEEIRASQAGKIMGIDVTFTKDASSGYMTIRSVQDGGPAEQAGVKKGDVVTAIDGKDTSKLSTSEIRSLIRDDDKKEAVLTVSRGGDTTDITVKKDYIENTEIVVGGMVKGTKTGYIAISGFTGLTAKEFSAVYDELNDEGMKGLIIDLRDNRGGLVSACVDTLRLFMPKCTLVYEKDKGSEETERTCDGETPIKIPLAVLVNENTASASEMFAGAIQDEDVGVIVGTQTYGKGIEQKTWTLGDGSAVKMTTTHYYTPDHRDINGKGITPDKKVSYDSDSGEDAQFNAAKKIVEEEES